MIRKKICFITGAHWAAQIGGAQYQVKCILEEVLKDESLDVYYLARYVNPDYEPQRYTVRQITKPNRVRRVSLLFDYRRLINHLNDIKPDIIYQRGLEPYTGFVSKFSLRNNCKFIFHVAHDFDVQPDKFLYPSKLPSLKVLEKKIGEYGLKNAGHIITQTHHQERLLKQNYDIASDFVMRNFHPKPEEVISKDEKSIKIVWVANFKPFKQPEIFVRLAKEMQSFKDLEFIMAGRPGPSNKYKALHEEISKISNLKYLNELQIGDVNKLLAKSHIFVNTSKAEGFANTFIQAWMRKVPVLSLYINTDNIFDDEKIGLYAGSYESLKENLIALVTNHKRRSEMGEHAQVYAYKYHSVDNVNKFISLIK